mmetsp:Transcript_9206/g.16847  ORF Transcript_9206/g.16847 Transcript_9206/m.16847 type:complete len:292 (+) Transcript_9206:522-1397(+)
MLQRLLRHAEAPGSPAAAQRVSGEEAGRVGIPFLFGLDVLHACQCFRVIRGCLWRGRNLGLVHARCVHDGGEASDGQLAQREDVAADAAGQQPHDAGRERGRAQRELEGGGGSDEPIPPVHLALLAVSERLAERFQDLAELQVVLLGILQQLARARLALAGRLALEGQRTVGELEALEDPEEESVGRRLDFVFAEGLESAGEAGVEQHRFVGEVVLHVCEDAFRGEDPESPDELLLRRFGRGYDFGHAVHHTGNRHRVSEGSCNQPLGGLRTNLGEVVEAQPLERRKAPHD